MSIQRYWRAAYAGASADRKHCRWQCIDQEFYRKLVGQMVGGPPQLEARSHGRSSIVALTYYIAYRSLVPNHHSHKETRVEEDVECVSKRLLARLKQDGLQNGVKSAVSR